MERRALQPPFTYGPDLPLADVKVGDVFRREGDRAWGVTSGTITKIKRVNFDYDSVYAPRPDFEQVMHLTAARAMLVGAMVVRGTVVHVVAA